MKGLWIRILQQFFQKVFWYGKYRDFHRFSFVLLICKRTNYAENVDEPILEWGMLELLGEIEICSIGDIYRYFCEIPRNLCNFRHFQWILPILGVWASAISPYLKILILHILVWSLSFPKSACSYFQHNQFSFRKVKRDIRCGRTVKIPILPILKHFLEEIL